jgi:hypothetical protein
MRRIALCAVVCLLLSGALAQARALPPSSSSRSTVHMTSAHTSKPHKKAKKHPKRQTATKLTTTTAHPAVAGSSSTTLFGDSTVESGLDSNAAGWAEAFRFANQTGGRVSTIAVYLASQNKATSLVAGIYSNNNGNPGSLLTSGTLSSLRSGAWNRVAVASVAIKSGTYWIGLLGRGGVIYFNDRSNGACVSENSSQMSATSLSPKWPTGGPTWSSCPVSAYVIGSPSATVATTGGTGGTGTGMTTTTPPSPLPPLLPPVDVLAPSVSGSAVDGQTLTTSDGTWLDNPSFYTYQWQDCSSSSCTDIAGATASSYTLTDMDIGRTVRSVATASNDAGSASADSVLTSSVAPPPAPANTVAPSVSGSTVQGQTLSTSNGSWSSKPTMFSYEWQDCNSSGTSCSTIAGANGSQYILAAADVGRTVHSVVTASNAGGSSSASSTASVAVTAPATPPANTAQPAVTGTTTQGQSLSTSNGSWSGNPTSFSYQWQDCNASGAGCANIAGATTSSYTLQASDVGDAVRSVVTGSNSAGSASTASAATATIIASGGGGGSSTYTCTQHVTTSTFSSAFSSAGSGAVLCLAPGNYGSFNASNKSSMVVITPDVSAGATAPTGNGNGDLNGNVTFSEADFSPAANITMDGVTFSGDVSVSGASHDLLFHDSLFHQHLVITDTSMNNANVTADYDMFPADKADCVGGPEGRIWINEDNHSSTPDGVTIENSNIGGTSAQCDGIQTGGYGPQILNNWIHDYHYQNNAHTDGVQDYGGSHEVVKGNVRYNVPDCYVSYDGTDHADIEDNVCVNDSSQNDGASPNVLVINDDSGSIVKHNTLAGFKDSYGNAGGILTIGSKSSSGSGTVLTDNVATGFNNCENGNCRPYTESHNLFIQGGPGGAGDVKATPVYQGGSCGSLSSSTGPFCSDEWSNYLLAAGSSGHDAADDSSDMGAYGSGPVTPGGP